MRDEADQTCRPHIEITDEDLTAALRDFGTYVDISIEDLKVLCASAAKHAEQRMAESVPVKDAMTRNVVAVSPHADIHEVSRLLSENRISGLPVVDSEGKVIGLVTEADILAMTGMKKGHTIGDVIRHLLGEPMPHRREGARVEDVMSSPALTVKPDADVREAAAILNEKRIKRLPVIDDDGRIVGIISRADIIRVAGKQ